MPFTQYNRWEDWDPPHSGILIIPSLNVSFTSWESFQKRVHIFYLSVSPAQRIIPGTWWELSKCVLNKGIGNKLKFRISDSTPNTLYDLWILFLPSKFWTSPIKSLSALKSCFLRQSHKATQCHIFLWRNNLWGTPSASNSQMGGWVGWSSLSASRTFSQSETTRQ